jgi:tetratricopeptide (TPR) repeat protein
MVATALPGTAAAAPEARALHDGAEQGLAAFQLGVSLYRKNDFAKAAGIFHTAFGLDAKPVYLFNAARSEHKGGDLDKALSDYDRCAGLQGADARIVAKAKEFATGIRDDRKKKIEAAAQARREQALLAQKKAADEAAWRSPAGWGSIGAGALLLGVGGWLLASASSDQSDLDAKTKEMGKDPDTDELKIVGIVADDYNAEFDSIQSSRALGITAGLAGLAAAGVGTWLLISAPSAPAVSISPALGGRGVRFSLRF